MSASIGATPLAEPGSTLDTVDQLLRDPKATLDRIEGGADLTAFAKTMILTIAASAAVFGAAMGSNRLGVQIFFAGIKLPMVVLFTAVICAPALSALNASLDRKADIRRDLALVLASLALGSLVLAALAPVVLLAITQHLQYQAIALLVVACAATGGTVGVSLLLRGLFRERRAAPVAFALMSVYALIGSQMTWTLRPWILRPRTPGVPFVREIDGSLLDAVKRSWDSSWGYYPEDRGYEIRRANPDGEDSGVQEEGWPAVHVTPMPDTRAQIDGADLQDLSALESRR
jgi:NADH:ubiquinone oxidoreductase subunit K